MTQESTGASEQARLFGPDMLPNPYPAYHRLRAADPVHWNEAAGGWVVTRYADVVALLRSPNVSSERMRGGGEKALPELQPLFAFRANSMINSDPPKHTRLRLLVNKAFTPAAVEALAPFIRRTVDGILDAAKPQGWLDLMRELAFPLPVIVISHMLGVPPEDRERFKRWSDTITAIVGNTPANLQTDLFRHALVAIRELTAYLKEVVDKRRAQPAGDLLSALAAAEEQGDRLSEDELFANAILLLNAGHETTTNLIGNGTLALLHHPEEWRKLQGDRSLLSSTVEEMLRYDSPVQFTNRLLKADMTLGGKQLKAGQSVLLLLGAANRDPEQFQGPDRLDVGRTENKHVAFGMGPHFCLGAPLARLEGRIVVEALLERMPVLRLDGPEPNYRNNFNLRGVETLPMAF